MPNQRKDDNILAPTLAACLEWLPGNGKISLARDIEDANTDEALYVVFKNLLTCLALPSKFKKSLLETVLIQFN